MVRRRASWARCLCIAGLMLGCSSSEHSDLFSPVGSSGSGGATGAGTVTGVTSTGSSSSATSASATGSGTGAGGGPTSGSGTATGGRTTSSAAGGQAGASSGAGGAASGAGGSSGGAAGSAAGAAGSGMAGAAGVAGTAGSGGGMAGSAGTGGAAGATGGAGGSGGTGGAGGNPGGVGATCTANDGCRQGLYCKKSGCGPVDLLGKCADRPNSCDFDDNPICGCDGFTYLNSCLAEMNGQNVATQPGICKDGVAIKCTPGSQACAGRPNAVCGILVADHSACSSANPPGKCWVIPDECVPTGTHYDSCTGGDHCVHTCDVVKQQKPYYPALDPACMP